MIFDKSIIEAAKEDARKRYPEESCGVITEGLYVPCENVAKNKDQDFQISSSITQPLIINNTLQGIIHSHPVARLISVSSPSKSDMMSQVAVNVPWGIIDLDSHSMNDPYFWGDFILDEPIIGRTFHHGINDCYTVIRKWYWQNKGIKLLDIPRGDLWWTDDTQDNLYVDSFEKVGFTRIKKEELQNGDVVMGKVRSNKVNHAGIYLDNNIDGHGVILHHLYDRLSRRESAYPYLNRSEIYVRYTKNAS